MLYSGMLIFLCWVIITLVHDGITWYAISCVVNDIAFCSLCEEILLFRHTMHCFAICCVFWFVSCFSELHHVAYHNMFLQLILLCLLYLCMLYCFGPLSSHSTLCLTSLYSTMIYYVALHHIALYYVILCYAMCHVVSSCFMLYFYNFFP